MKTRTHLLLATSAIFGVAAFSATPAFAEVNTGAGTSGTTISDAATLDANQNTNLFLSTATETITVGESATQTIGDGEGDAVTAEHGAGPTTLSITNTGAGDASMLNVKGNLQKEASQDLSLEVTNAETQDLNIAMDGDLALGAGTVTVTSSANDTGLSLTGGKAGVGAISLDGQNGGVASLTLNGSSAQTVNGAIDADTASANTGIVVNNSEGVTFGGIVGGSTPVDTLNVTAGNANFGAAATFSGNVSGSGTMTNADAINVGGDITVGGVDLDTSGALTLNGPAEQTINSTIDGVADTDGSITVNNTGGATFNGVIGGNSTVGSLTVTAGDTEFAADGSFSANVSVAGAQSLTNRADLTVGGNLASTGTLNNSAGATATIAGDVAGASTIENAGVLTINGGDNAGTINNTGRLNVGAPLTNTGTIDLSSVASEEATVGLANITAGQTAISGATVNLTGNARVLLNPDLAENDVVTLTDQDSIDAAVAAGQLTVDNALRKVTVDESVAGVTMTMAGAKSAAETASTLGVSVSNGSKLNQAGNATFAGGFAAVDTAISNALTGTAAEAKSAAEQLGDATAAAGAASDAAVSAFSASGQSIGNRLASLRGTESSVAAGNSVASNNVWFEAHASSIDQDARKGAEGFEVDNYGGTIGFDGALGKDKRLGVAFTYSNSDVDGDSAANVNQDVDSYIVNLYGEKAMGHNFLNGSAHFGVQNVNVAQNVLGLGRLSGDYSTEQYGANVEFGRNIKLGGGKLIPTAGLNWTRIDGDSVTLTGGGNIVTDSFDSRDVIMGKLGARYELEHQTSGGSLLRPAVYGSLGYDFASDEVASTRSFGGTLVRDQQADIAEESVGFGAAFTYETADRMTAVQVGYDGEYRDEYLRHSGQVRLSLRF